MELKREQIVYVGNKPHIKGKLEILPTAKESNIILSRFWNSIFLTPPMNVKSSDIYQYLYITSIEEVKESDLPCYVIYNGNKTVQFITDKKILVSVNKECSGKIIATTDESLRIIRKVSLVEGNTRHTCDEHVKLPKLSQQFIAKYIEEYNKGNQIVDVLVEVEWFDKLNYNSKEFNKAWENNEDYHLKLDSQNTITIRKIKDSWSREEVSKLLIKAISECNSKDGILKNKEPHEAAKWIEENL